MSAAVGDFSLSNSDTTELEDLYCHYQSLWLVYQTLNSVGYLYWHRLCWQPFPHVQKVNYVRSSTVYSRIMLTPYNYLLFRKLCPQNSRIPNSLFIVTLIMQRWTKLGAHAHSNTSIFKTTTVFFSGKYGFNMLSLSLRLALCSCQRRTTRFLRLWRQLEQ